MFVPLTSHRCGSPHLHWYHSAIIQGVETHQLAHMAKMFPFSGQCHWLALLIGHKGNAQIRCC